MDRERDRGHRLSRGAEEMPVGAEDRVLVWVHGEIAAFAGAADGEPGRNALRGDGHGNLEGQAEAIEPGTEVGRRRGNDGAPARDRPACPSPRGSGAHSRMNRRSARGSASTFSITFETATARSGSLSPCPVQVQTMMRRPSSFRCEATFN